MKTKVLILVLAAFLVVATGALAVSYLLDRTVPATVTITAPPGPLAANIYSDPAGTIRFDGVFNFGTMRAGDGVTLVSVFYVRGAEINPATLVVVSNLPNSQGTLEASVDHVNNYGNYPVTLSLTIKTQASLGQLQFLIRVKGQS